MRQARVRWNISFLDSRYRNSSAKVRKFEQYGVEQVRLLIFTLQTLPGRQPAQGLDGQAPKVPGVNAPAAEGLDKGDPVAVECRPAPGRSPR